MRIVVNHVEGVKQKGTYRVDHNGRKCRRGCRNHGGWYREVMIPEVFGTIFIFLMAVVLESLLYFDETLRISMEITSP